MSSSSARSTTAEAGTEANDTLCTAGCNTGRARAWAFTVNNPTADDWAKVRALAGEAYYQEETGAEGTVHIQGCVRFTNGKTLSAMKRLLPRAHLEVCRSWVASTRYCSKEATRTGETSGPEVIRDPLEGRELRPFQQEILDIVASEPDDRTVHWYWEADGRVGKTWLTKSLCLRYPGQVCLVGGKAADAYYAVAQFIDKFKRGPRLVVMDLVRSREAYVSYEAIEGIKNGLFFAPKYESGQVLMNCPHMLVFANYPPDESKLSADRWHIQNIC